MEFNNLKNGDKLRIKNKIYEVLSIREEADVAKPPEYKVRKIIAIYLHELGSKSLHPTNVLWYYPDTKELFFLKMKQEKPLKGLKRVRERGGLISFYDKVELDIKRVHLDNKNNSNIKILEKLAKMLEKLLKTPKKKQIAISISKYCAKFAEKVQDEKVEEILAHCVDLNHWGWKELPPTLTLKKIKEEFLPEVRRLIIVLRKE